jgi:hypothetical protein
VRVPSIRLAIASTLVFALALPATLASPASAAAGTSAHHRQLSLPGQPQHPLGGAPAGPPAGLPPAAPPRSRGGGRIEPHSKHPSEMKPYFVCPPPTKTRASCLAVGGANPRKLKAAGRPVPRYQGSGERGGFSPKDLRDAYKLPAEGGKGMTVAITIAYDDPKAEEDLAVYREHYELPPCTSANGCFSKVNQEGEEANYPKADGVWATETSLDLDMVSAICPECHILLVEADSNYFEDLGPAVEEAAALEADVISDSWAGEELSGEAEYDHYFDHPGVPVLFASGDWGFGVYYPAASPDVIAVGGTSLHKEAKASRGWSESAWEGAGSGCSAYEEKPAWQKDEGCEKRTVADVSAVADPYTPVSVYDSFESSGWRLFGGTSVATPLLAGVEALSSGAFRTAGPSAFTRTGQAAGLFDPTEGSNGHCDTYLCEAEVGYDGPTGWGTPDGALDLPTATTEAATVESASKVTLHGSVDPKGLETEYHFEYGETTEYGSRVPAEDLSAGSGNEYVEANQPLEGLEGHTPYHYRIVATNSEGTFYGGDRSFGTTPPSVATGEAGEVHANDATLHASVNPEGLATKYYFEYGTSASYGRLMPARPESAGSGTEAVAVSATAGALTGSRTYHFRVVARNVAGTEYGEDQTFRTEPTLWAADPMATPPGNPLPGGHPYWNELTGVSCVSASYCMAVGDYLSYYEQMASKLWNGIRWVEYPMATPEHAREVIVLNVSCASKEWCVAVGFYSAEDSEGNQEGLPLIEHWDGSQWTVDPVTVPEGAHNRSINSDVLLGASCVSSSMCVAVGFYSNEASNPGTRPLAYKWNGTEWETLTMPIPPASSGGEVVSQGVSCASTSWCMVVGHHTSSERAWYQPFAEAWSGGEWTTVLDESPHPNEEAAYLSGVSCAAIDGCTALSYTPFWKTEEIAGPIARWDGEEWSYESPPEPAGTKHTIPTSVSCVSVTACTTAGYSYTWEDGYVPAASTWNGSEWSLQSTAEPSQEEEGSGLPQSDLQSVSCVSAETCVAVGGYLTQGEQWRGMAELYPAPQPPSASTEAASTITESTATLNGKVNPEGFPASYHFEYSTAEYKEGEETPHGTSVPVPGESVGAGEGDVEVHQTITGLKSHTHYHFRLVAEGPLDVSYGEDQTFRTHNVEMAGTVLCSEDVATCAEDAVHLSGTSIQAHLAAGTNLTIAAGATEVTCKKSTLTATTEAEVGSPLPVGIGFSATKCTSAGESCTVSQVGGSAGGIEAAGATGDGTLTRSGEGSPGFKVICSSLECTYSAAAIPFDLGGGNPASLAAEVTLEYEAGSESCASTAQLSAAYTIESPAPLFVSGGT